MPTVDALRDTLKAQIAAARTAAQRRDLAAALRSLADTLDALADAQQRDIARPREQRVAPTQRQGSAKGGRPSVPFVVILRRERKGIAANEVRIKFSRALYDQLGTPQRIDVQRIDNRLTFVPLFRGDSGYKVIVNIGGSSINASGARDIISEADGKYHVTISSADVQLGDPFDQ